MGLNSYILVKGKFKDFPDRSILEYPKHFYCNTMPDTEVFGSIGDCPSSGMSQLLAEMCGCEVWDFNTHKLSKDKLTQYDELYDFDFNYCEEFNQWYIEIESCFNAGLELWFMPNG